MDDRVVAHKQRAVRPERHHHERHAAGIECACRRDHRCLVGQFVPHQLGEFVEVWFDEIGRGLERFAQGRSARVEPYANPPGFETHDRLAIKRNRHPRRKAASENTPARLDGIELANEGCEILRRRSEAGEVQIGGLAALRVHDFQAGAGRTWQTQAGILDAARLQEGREELCVIASEETQRGSADTLRRECGGDVDAFTAGAVAKVGGTVHRTGRKPAHFYGAINGRIERHSRDVEEGGGERRHFYASG